MITSAWTVFIFTMTAARFSQHGHRVKFAAAAQPPAILVSKESFAYSIRKTASSAPLLRMRRPSQRTKLTSQPATAWFCIRMVSSKSSIKTTKCSALKALQRLVRESTTQSLPQMKQTILEGVASWRNGPLADDISVVIVEVRQ